MKVYAKIRKKLICLLTGLFTVCLFLASVMSPYTQSKYIFEVSDPDAKIEISVQNQIEITSVEQFKTAIENGYSNIKIADAVASPLLFISNELDLKADLVIDLNGHELQRTGSDAMINVPEGITLTIYDSDSADSDSIASLYNPVGSVIDVTGGNLSLVCGKIESGVRANEYSTAENSGSACGSVRETLTATLYTKYIKTNGKVTQSADYQTVENVTLPNISAAEIKSGNYTLVDGNIYVPAGKTLSSTEYTFDANNPLSGGGDYYLYYMNESNTYTAVSSGTADFYYEYTDNGEKITICGFYKNFDKADSEDTTYAAIRMESGKLNVFGGEYYQYFGVDNNYCVYATGGDMTVYGGTFVAEGYSTCLGCNFMGTEETGTLKVKAGEYTSYLGDGIRIFGFAKSMTDADDMTVTGGKFIKIVDKQISVGGQTAEKLGEGYDSNGSAINMVSGKLTVQGASDQSQDDLIQFTAYGGGMNGIKCGAGAFIDCKNTEFLFNCDYEGSPKNSSGKSTQETTIANFTHNIGILNYAGTVTAENTLFRLNTEYNVGIYSTADELFTNNSGDASASGTVTVISSMFSMTGEKSVGVLTTRGTVTLGSKDNLGTTGQDRYVMFYIDHVQNCFGMYVAGVDTDSNVGSKDRGLIKTSESTEDTATVNSIAAQFYLGQTGYKTGKEETAPEYYQSSGKPTEQRLFNSCGIYMNASGSGSKVTIGRTMVFSAGSYTAGIFVRSGEVEQKEINGKAYKFAVLMGIRVENYGAGGYYDDTIDTKADHSSENTGHYREKFGMTWYVAQYGADNYTSEQIFDVEQANAKGCYGINTLGGTIDMYNCYLGIYSTWSNGIYSLGGKVHIYGYDTNGDGAVDSGLDCKVIIFGADENDETNPNANIAANTNLSSPYSFSGAATGDRLITSCVVRTGNNTSNSGNYVYIGAGNIYTDNYGFYVESGDLIFGSDDEGITSTINNTEAKTIIISYRAPAIVLKDGNIEVSENDTLQITDTLNTATSFTYKDANGNTQTKSVEKWQDFTADGTIPTDAVYISGGSFTSRGILNITFTGLENDNQSGTAYAPLDNLIKSYAVSVDGGNIAINNEAHISVSVGGGVLADGGSVTLGAQGTTVDNSKIKIETTGYEYYGTLRGTAYGNWQYYVSKTGGHAVSVMSGDLTVYYGTYTAKLGNGIMVSNGTATVYDGIYYGLNSTVTSNQDGWGSGLGSYYGLLLCNGGTFNSYGGIFAGANGGAFVHGASSSYCVTANIYAGSFVRASESMQNTTNGFSIGLHATVTFGGATGVADSENTGDILIGGTACGIAVENNGALGTRTADDVYLYIYSGTYNCAPGTSSGRTTNMKAIWNGNEYAKITLADCKLYGQTETISSGTNVSLLTGQKIYYVSNNAVTSSTTVNTLTGNLKFVIISSDSVTSITSWDLFIAYSLASGALVTT